MNKKKVIIHLSDLHFRQNWDEDQGVVLDGFFKDLAKQIEQSKQSDIFVAFSGDIVRSGGNAELYSGFMSQFDSELNKLGIQKMHRICVPGNHDISIDSVKRKFVEHEAVIAQRLDENKFNDYISSENHIFLDKFSNYNAFESQFASHGIVGKSLGGGGWTLDENIGLYCLNTAICASGGYEDVDDRGRLAVDTRSLHRWILESKEKIKILIMHHPKEDASGGA